ncbi:MAG: hypothetical protein IH848_02900, partial [Acidobacteria bacterium]|nr:hypothetical protein [Acidobacteriota bacterium]
MLQTALDYIADNQAGQTNIWICSDLRENDWQPEDGRWANLRTGFEQLPAVRFFLLSYPEVAQDNLAVRIERVRKRQVARTSELVFDLTLRSAGDDEASAQVPLELIINGARTALDAK